MDENTEELFEIHEKSEKWFNDHIGEFEHKYGSKFFAIKNQEILATDENLERLIKTIEEKGEDINKVFIASIPPKGLAAIL
jgi:hypothetical protein